MCCINERKLRHRNEKQESLQEANNIFFLIIPTIAILYHSKMFCINIKVKPGNYGFIALKTPAIQQISIHNVIISMNYKVFAITQFMGICVASTHTLFIDVPILKHFFLNIYNKNSFYFNT